jgi:hypothetical protein
MSRIDAYLIIRRAAPKTPTLWAQAATHSAPPLARHTSKRSRHRPRPETRQPASSKTTDLYDRLDHETSREEVEGIAI